MSITLALTTGAVKASRLDQLVRRRPACAPLAHADAHRAAAFRPDGRGRPCWPLVRSDWRGRLCRPLGRLGRLARRLRHWRLCPHGRTLCLWRADFTWCGHFTWTPRSCGDIRGICALGSRRRLPHSKSGFKAAHVIVKALAGRSLTARDGAMLRGSSRPLVPRQRPPTGFAVLLSQRIRLSLSQPTPTLSQLIAYRKVFLTKYGRAEVTGYPAEPTFCRPDDRLHPARDRPLRRFGHRSMLARRINGRADDRVHPWANHARHAGFLSCSAISY
jgi:hypothetical protein